jgi:hypothetical protein
MGYSEGKLCSARLSPHILVVGDASATLPQRRLQYLTQRLMQSGYLLKRQVPGFLQGVDFSPEQGLIGIHVTHPRQDFLVAEHRLDRGRALLQALCQ